MLFDTIKYRCLTTKPKNTEFKKSKAPSSALRYLGYDILIHEVSLKLPRLSPMY